MKVGLSFIALFIYMLTGFAQSGMVYTFNSKRIQQAQSDFQSNKLNLAIQKLLKESDKALIDKKIYSVATKKQTPPSGDKHAYMSLAPYWFPDSSKADGLPYIRKDGQRNPEAKLYQDNTQLNKMCKQVMYLSLAFSISEKTAYAQKATQLLQVWFLDSATRMNPNLNYAQAIKGRSDGRGSGIVDARAFIELLDAVELLRANKALDDSVYNGLKVWFKDYFTWLKDSPNGKDERNAKNNHGTWFVAQFARVALFVGEKELALMELLKLRERIAWQIEPDGKQPLELVRTKSLSYSLFNLEAYTKAFLQADKLGLDLWNYETADGRSFKKALDYVLPYAMNPETWPEKQISKVDREDLYAMLRILVKQYPTESTYLAWMQKLQIEFPQSISALIY